MSGEGVPTIHTNQLKVIANHLHQINTNDIIWPDKES